MKNEVSNTRTDLITMEPKACYYIWKATKSVEERTEAMQDLVSAGQYVNLNGVLSSWNGLYWEASRDMFYREFASWAIASTHAIAELYSLLTLNAPKVEFEANVTSRYIPFQNGYYDKHTRELIAPVKEALLTSVLKIKFEDAYTEYDDFDGLTWLRNLAPNDRMVSVLADSIDSQTCNRKLHILYGDGLDGKGTFTQLLYSIYGMDKVTIATLQAIGSQYGLGALTSNTALVIGDDNDSNAFMVNSSNMKSLVSHDPIQIEKKGRGGYTETVRPRCTVIQNFNSLPSIKDTAPAVYERMNVVKFNPLERTDINPDIKNIYLRDTAVVTKLVYDVVTLVDWNNIDFKIDDALLNDVRKGNNPLMIWYEEMGEKELEKEHIASSIYTNYKQYCLDNNYSQLSNIQFNRMLAKEYNWVKTVKRVDGKARNMYVK